MDNKKQKYFRGAHPKRYQEDCESLITRSVRSRSIGGGQGSRIAELLERSQADRRSVAGQSMKSRVTDASQMLQKMSYRAVNEQNPEMTSKRVGKQSLKEFLNEN